MPVLGFPVWLRATHILNVLFLSLLMRSGLEILSAHPKLYWNDDCRPGSEWLSFTRRPLPEHELWTAQDEEVGFPAVLALPGGSKLGLGRHWHFLSVAAWLLTGLVYVVLLFALDEWRRLLPTSWSVFPHAWQALRTYATFQLPPPGNPYNALQQLTYAAVVFLLAPFSLATGAAMSPAVAARFPAYTRLFHGRQAARSLHFLALLAFVAFTVMHTVMVVAHGLPQEWARIVLGVTEGHNGAAVVVGVTGLVIIGLIHLLATWSVLRWPRRSARLLGATIAPPRWLLLHHLTSRQHYPAATVSPFFRVNGRPPREPVYDTLVQTSFSTWVLEVDGLVEHPLRLTLADLQRLPQETQVTKHVCIQGWSGIAAWTGVPVQAVLERCRPLPSARYLVFHAFDDKAHSEPTQQVTGYFYETIDLELARHPQTLLALAMNGQPLPVEHGAPMRLRVETQLGFKMVKWVRAIEVVADYRGIGEGQGGWREDNQHYSAEASI